MSVNIYDIAKKAGVSSATVSRYINKSGYVGKKTAEKIAAAIEFDHYVPNPIAQNLSRNTSFRLVGLICCDIEDLYYARAISVLEKQLKKNDYEIILSCSGTDVEEKKRCIDMLISKNVEAIIFIGSVFMERSAKIIRDAAKKVPCFIINAELTGENVYCVYADERTATETAVTEMINSGKNSPVFLYDVETYGSKMKSDGFRDALAKAGKEISKELFIRCETSLNSAEEAVLALLKEKKCDAVLCSNDLLACGVLSAARKLGISVPEGLAVIGHNNSVIASLTSPLLSSIDNKVTELSEFTAQNIVNLFSGKQTVKNKKIPFELVRRESF